MGIERGPYTWSIDGRIYDLRKDSPKLIEQLAIEHATAAVWKKAAKGRRYLDGLQGTVDWTILRKMMRHLEKFPKLGRNSQEYPGGRNVAADQTGGSRSHHAPHQLQ